MVSFLYKYSCVAAAQYQNYIIIFKNVKKNFFGEIDKIQKDLWYNGYVVFSIFDFWSYEKTLFVG